MDCHNPITTIDVPENAKKIVLAGNPNVGKSVFFNYLTGLYVDVSNFPGTTIDISSGKFNNDVIMDTPGVYGVSSFNDEERVARDIILYADVILNIVDAVHLERDLFLTQQIIDMGKPVVVALNMMDDVKRNGLKIDIDLLSKELGVEVIPTTAIKGEGLDKVKEAISRARTGNRIKEIKEIIDKVKDNVDTESEALLLAEEDENIIARHNVKDFKGEREHIYKLRRNRVDKIVDKIITETNKDASFKIKLGRMMLKPITGIPILLAALYIMYKAIGVFVAQTVVGITEEIIMGEYYYNFIMNTVGKFFNDTTLIGQLLIGEFGLITMVPIYIFGLLLPLVVGFYFFLSLMEDSGYLPRIAALVDRALTTLGLNGRAIIPMILGFGCVTMATITTRLLGSKREKFIATMLLGLAIPCSAQLGVIMGLIAPLGLKAFIIYSATIFAVFVITGTLLNKLMPGESTDLLIDLPPLRLPKINNVLKKTYLKSVMFLKEATPLFIVGGLLITVLQYTGLLDSIASTLEPFTVGFLKLHPKVSQAFIMGIVRRDFGAAGLNDLASQGLLNGPQLIVSLVAITLFVPCIAAIMVIFKERSWQESALIYIGSFIISFLTAGILAQFIV
ncbi:ferrous iron transport protein B [Paramaledivibacter caminithermalis]|jgi:ferrous iron transport protein B|uniref:Ferrous iron transport protein B n=1 Tax=Paramaledivibacter caminithermalis (strain DSM 15212 / CIP 107654 / DViRD3) TaxID=1121301 RepID=A0A1M6SLE5_PARC5|nr:ferrous iron transport protein B [Paramaledivibacter caminithermalis]SHK45561.1 ferrous iron transport protein B [Paramaledivibacter caminithermalis DSM 15212]